MDSIFIPFEYFDKPIHELPIETDDLGSCPIIRNQYLFSKFDQQDFKWERTKDIKLLLNIGMLRPALTLAMTLPDICGKVKYPHENDVGKRYALWFNENVLKYQIGEVGRSSNQFDCFNGYMCYMLRCRMVHGDAVPIEDIPNKPDSHFRKNGYDKVIFRFTTAQSSQFLDIVGNIRLAIFFKSIPQLVMEIISNAEACYEDEPDKSKFGDGCEIISPVAIIR